MCACVYGHLCESGSVYANVLVWQFVGEAHMGLCMHISVCNCERIRLSVGE